MPKAIKPAQRTLDGNWRVETTEGTRWFSTLKQLELGVDDLELQIPEALLRTTAAWADLDKKARNVDQLRRDTFDVLVRELVDGQHWSRADVAHFLGKTATVINRSLVRSDPEAK